MGNALDGAKNGLSLRMRRKYFTADLLKSVSVEAIKAFGSLSHFIAYIPMLAGFNS